MAGLGLGWCPGQLGTGHRSGPWPCLCGQEGMLSPQLSGHQEAGASDGNVAPLAPMPQLPFPALSPVLAQKGQTLRALSPAPACLPFLSCSLRGDQDLQEQAVFFLPGKALFPLLSPWKWSLSCDPTQSPLLLCTAGSQGQLHGKMTA